MITKTSKKLNKLINQITFILYCAKQHSNCPDSWGTPKTKTDEFYYAYSHVSFVCSCLLTKADLGTSNNGFFWDAEYFTDLLYHSDHSWTHKKWNQETGKLIKNAMLRMK